MTDPLPPWPEGPRRCPHCGDPMFGRLRCRCREVSPYLRRPLRSYLQARADRLITRLNNRKGESRRNPGAVSHSVPPETAPLASRPGAALSP